MYSTHQFRISYGLPDEGFLVTFPFFKSYQQNIPTDLTWRIVNYQPIKT